MGYISLPHRLDSKGQTSQLQYLHWYAPALGRCNFLSRGHLILKACQTLFQALVSTTILHWLGQRS
ncbi:hypothetical protein ACKS0A_02084 [Histoplasma ohiense]